MEVANERVLFFFTETVGEFPIANALNIKDCTTFNYLQGERLGGSAKLQKECYMIVSIH